MLPLSTKNYKFDYLTVSTSNSFDKQKNNLTKFDVLCS